MRCSVRSSRTTVLACIAAAHCACESGPATIDASDVSDAGDVSDAAACTVDPASPFERVVIDTSYRAEAVAVLDVNRDGHADIATDQFWYEVPGFASHPIGPPMTFDPAMSFAHGFGIYPADVDADGWTDLVVAPHPGDAMFWYRNPQGADVMWAANTVASAGVAGIETPLLASVFAASAPVLLTSNSPIGVLGWSPLSADTTQPWPIEAISAPQFSGASLYAHGLGVGDVNGDGRVDVLTSVAWFEQSATGSWPMHAFPDSMHDDCSRLWVYDVDGDGLGDVFCARPHTYGLSWYAQQPTAAGVDPTFVEHPIDTSISQLHSLRLADLDGDGVPEIVVGKRWYAHLPSQGLDPGNDDPAVLAYFTMSRASGAVAFTRHIVDCDSGAGTAFDTADVDGDGRIDIVVSNKKGLYFFRHR